MNAEEPKKHERDQAERWAQTVFLDPAALDGPDGDAVLAEWCELVFRGGEEAADEESCREDRDSD